MSTEALTLGNPTVILFDCAIGFANIVRSHDIGNFDRTVQLLTRTALE